MLYNYLDYKQVNKLFLCVVSSATAETCTTIGCCVSDILQLYKPWPGRRVRRFPCRRHSRTYLQRGKRPQTGAVWQEKLWEKIQVP